jgi:hypothetical protein
VLAVLFVATVAAFGMATAGSVDPAAACNITAPANITVSNDPNQAGAVVVYPAPTTDAAVDCGTLTCSPASGSCANRRCANSHGIGVIEKDFKQGRHAIRLPRRLNGERLTPGRYLAELQATAGGNTSAPFEIEFRLGR